jgi:hypothetical protein
MLILSTSKNLAGAIHCESQLQKAQQQFEVDPAKIITVLMFLMKELNGKTSERSHKHSYCDQMQG